MAKFQIPLHRKVLFATATLLLSLAATLGALAAFDVHLHHKFERAAGLNVWGYRGSPVGKKRPGEVRVVVLGGSTVLGFGLDEKDVFPQQLEVMLNANRSASDSRTYSVVNLGYNQAGAYSFRYTLEDYRYLDYDVVCLYEGYNDLGNPNRYNSRRDWIVFRLTGYMPMLPIVIAEKIRLWRYGDVRGPRPDAPLVFRSGIVSRTKADALEASKRITDALERQLRNVNNSETDPRTRSAVDDCSTRWTFYCSGVATAIDFVRRQGKSVVVVTQPYIGGGHREQQADLRKMLGNRYARDASVRYVNLGDAVDTTDPSMCWDGMHLTPEGNRRLAAALLPSVRAATAAPRRRER